MTRTSGETAMTAEIDAVAGVGTGAMTRGRITMMRMWMLKWLLTIMTMMLTISPPSGRQWMKTDAW